ncbi:MAG: ribonuclease P protein component [Dysgonomonas sp.]|nr:ribonuclease P protein component [Dysgonomonas sp.]
MTTEETIHNATFPKEEKLCSTKSIDMLFARAGNSFIAYPLRVVYLLFDEPEIEKQHPSVMISVSKKKFKRAVKRNRVKRLIREAYRLNKNLFHQTLQIRGKRMDIAFLYLKNELPTFAEIEKAMIKAATVLHEKEGREK